jgi:hypothetical protein
MSLPECIRYRHRPSRMGDFMTFDSIASYNRGATSFRLDWKARHCYPVENAHGWGL